MLTKLRDPFYWRKAAYIAREKLTRSQNLEYELGRSVEFLPLRPLQPGVRRLTILSLVSQYDYASRKRGYSYEENNYIHTFHSLGHEVIRLDVRQLRKRLSARAVNDLVLEAVYRFDPDLLFTVLFRDELDPATVEEISQETRTTTFNWFADDDWRFGDYSLEWAPRFNWCATTSRRALAEYRQRGMENVLKSQYGFNPFLYRHLDLEPRYDVTFVGQPHSTRLDTIAALRAAGLDVHCWGFGWPAGRLSQREMVQIFNQSRICLNFSSASRRGTIQIKGRDFELPGCGAFMLTGANPDLAEFYEIGREIETYTSVDELIEKARYYLTHDAERRAIAAAGHRRAQAAHGYPRRFADLFVQMGLGDEPAAEPHAPEDAHAR